MEKIVTKKISIWEKVSDFLMDIAKYVLTAVIITSAFEELADVGWMMYLWRISGALILFLLSCHSVLLTFHFLFLYSKYFLFEKNQMNLYKQLQV